MLVKSDSSVWTRREFAKGVGAAGLLSAGVLPPEFLARAAAAGPGDSTTGRVLVVVQLTGGNDGLNTVIPFRDDSYFKSRPGIGIPADQILRLKGVDLGLHPRMGGLRSLFDDGKVAIVQGVGYSNPNRSHFRSMDIWHTAQPDSERIVDGWLGRALDGLPGRTTGAMPALALGVERLPLALLSTTTTVPAIRDADGYRLEAGPEPQATRLRGSLKQLTDGKSQGDSDLDYVRRTALSAYQSAERLRQVVAGDRSTANYPATGLGQKIAWVAKMIRGDLGTRIFYVTLDGFDTHSKQANSHAGLLAEFSDAVKAFFVDLKSHRLDDRVMLASFSEFGRRVQENASLGTDHGAASQMFLVGGKLKPGIHGKHPSLTDLVEGDLKFHTDFRSVYATLLDRWLEIPSQRVLGRKFSPIAVV